MTDGPSPALSWSPPVELRAALVAAREGLRAAEDALAGELVAAFGALVQRAPPGERKVLVDLYAAIAAREGNREAERRLHAAWAACEAAYEAVGRAEDDLQRALPPTIDIVLTPPPAEEDKP